MTMMMRRAATAAEPDARRRGFLRGLATLPLIGGGVRILGNPTSAAVPVTRDLLDSYASWLYVERSQVLRELHGPEWERESWALRVDNPGYHYFYESFRNPETFPAPSTRAAVVLSAVGCPLVERRPA